MKIVTFSIDSSPNSKSSLACRAYPSGIPYSAANGTLIILIISLFKFWQTCRVLLHSALTE